MNKDIMIAIGFSEHVEDVENKICPLCKKQISIDDFRDGISLKEYQISGMCQQCQDDFFGC